MSLPRQFLQLPILGLLLASSLFTTVYANNFVTEPNTAVYYCGFDSDTKTNPGGTQTAARATKWAAKAAETSPYGASLPEYKKLKTITMMGQPIVRESSTLFAQGASGRVRLYEDCLNADGRQHGVWKTEEEPALEKNKAVTALHVVDPSTEVEYVVWTRGADGSIHRNIQTPTGTPIWKSDPAEWMFQIPTPPGTPPMATQTPGTRGRSASPKDRNAPPKSRNASPQSRNTSPGRSAPPRGGSPTVASKKTGRGQVRRRL